MYSCSLCSQKGFICKICNNGEILYPLRIFQQAGTESLVLQQYTWICHITVLLGQIGPTFCQALCLSLPLHQISWCPGEYFLPFGFLHLFPTHFASFIQNDITKLQKTHSLDLSYLVTKSLQLHFWIKMGVEEFSQPSQDQVIGYGNHSLKRKTQTGWMTGRKPEDTGEQLSGSPHALLYRCTTV